MEIVLHAQKITRELNAPVHVGDEDYMFFGSKAEGEDDIIHPSQIRLGSPLCEEFGSSHRDHIPMLKTFGFGPDFSEKGGRLYTETVHLITPTRDIIPFRTKIQSGPMKGTRISHLPNLNYIRNQFNLLTPPVRSPTPRIVDDLVESDDVFTSRTKHPIVEWIKEDLIDDIEALPSAELSFSDSPISYRIGKFLNSVEGSSYHDMNKRTLTNVANTIVPNPMGLPIMFQQREVAYNRLGNLIKSNRSNDYNLDSYGNITTPDISSILRNPRGFGDVLEFLDSLPFSDVNVDVVMNGREILLFHSSFMVNRYSTDARPTTGELSEWHPDRFWFDHACLKKVVTRFIKRFSWDKPNLVDYIQTHPIKLKIVKTISDEAVVFIYEAASGENAEPLCGAYFDIALMSLAPFSVTER